ncbi:MAG: serine hydrolase [Anaerolineales bacterium]|nr:serine hydrolase [Anaerolineales bacterium]
MMARTRKKSSPNRLTTALIIFLVLLIIGPTYLVWLTSSRKGAFADYLVTHPEASAIVAYTVDAAGNAVEDDSAIFHNADSPFVIASTVKLAVLAAYAEGVTTGRFNSAEEIPVAEWEQYYLPGTDGGAHAQGLKSVGLETDELGFAVDQTATVPLDEIARMMIHYSGNAATDYLLARIGPAEMARIITETGLEQQTPIHLILGPALAIFNHERPPADSDYLQAIITEVNQGNTAQLDSLVDHYLHDAAWRTAQIAFMTTENSAVTLPEEQVWAYQVLASELFPRGTARDYAGFMARVSQGKLLSEAASAIMQSHLETVPSDFPLRLLYFDPVGAKDGVTAGVLALASYAVPKRGDAAGQMRVVVILTNELPLEVWSQQLQVEGHYLLQTDLARASGTFDELKTMD